VAMALGEAQRQTDRPIMGATDSGEKV
jgi:hypothetical protein